MIRLLAKLRRCAIRLECRDARRRERRGAWYALAWACCAVSAFGANVRADETAEETSDATAATEVLGDDATGEAAAVDVVAGEAAMDESRFIRARFSDGTVLVGELLLDELEVETDFGTLVVPRQELLGLSPGLDSRSDFDERIDDLVAALASSDRGAATAAERELTRLGPAIAGELARRAGKFEGDAAKRVAALRDRIAEAEFDVEAMHAQQDRPLIRKDRVRTTKFTIVGRIVPRELRFKSRYGEIEADIADVVAVERQTNDEREDVAKSLSVTGQNLAQTQMKKTGVSVRKGDRIVVSASGMIRRTPGTSSYVSSPDGSTRFGTYSTNPQILGGTLIAKIGKNGKPIKVGSNASFVAKENGTLSMGVAMRPDYVGRYPFPGEYKVKLRVKRGD